MTYQKGEEVYTCKQAMIDAGLYPTSDEDAKGFIGEDTVDINGKTYTLSSIQKMDVAIFADELDSVLERQNPMIHDIFGRSAVNIFDLIRMINTETKQGFKGMGGSGNQLDLLLMNPRLFYDPDNSGNTRTSWSRTIAAIGSKNFIEGSDGGGGTEVTMSEQEGFIILGLYNPAVLSCIDSIQINMNTEPYNVQMIDFDTFDEETGDVIVELKEIWTLPPQQSGEMLAYYFQVGTDETRPIGCWIKQARALRDLTSLRSTSST